MGQYYRPILGDAFGLNCKIFDRSVDGQYTFAKLLEHSWWQNPFVNAFSEFLYNEPSRVVSVVGVTSTNFTLDDKFLLNHDTKQFVNLNEYKAASIDKHGWIIHPLPLLTAVGNDRGSGDFHEGNTGYDYVGLWAWQLISIADKPPNDFSKIKIRFIEK